MESKPKRSQNGTAIRNVKEKILTNLNDAIILWKKVNKSLKEASSPSSARDDPYTRMGTVCERLAKVLRNTSERYQTKIVL